MFPCRRHVPCPSVMGLAHNPVHGESVSRNPARKNASGSCLRRAANTARRRPQIMCAIFEIFKVRLAVDALLLSYAKQ
jgi:hypothetical protein